jgi:hypothetical protein
MIEGPREVARHSELSVTLDSSPWGFIFFVDLQLTAMRRIPILKHQAPF